MRATFLLLSASLLMLTGWVSAARRESVEPFYLEFATFAVAGDVDTCRLFYYSQPQECGYLDISLTTRLSPDGQWRAYATTNNQGDWAIYRASTSRKFSEQLTDFGNYHSISLPIWSPDGRWIAFSAFQFGTFTSFNIYRMEVATGEVRQITMMAGTEAFPAWSPDGERMVFNLHDWQGTTSVVTMRPEGGSVQEVLGGLSQSFSTVWSPDGAWLLFASDCPLAALRSRDGLPCAPNRRNLFRVRVADGHIEPLAALSNDDYDPTWSADGEWIAFASRPSPAERARIFRIRPDGSDLQPVTTDPSRDYFYPAWAKTPNFAWRPFVLLIIGLVCVSVVWWKKP